MLAFYGRSGDDSSMSTENDTRRTAADLAQAYFDAWRAHDFDALQALLADDVHFEGPLAVVDGAEACRRGLEGLAQMASDIAVKRRFADGDDALTWFEIHADGLPPIPVANWMHAADGRIARIRVTFDPRPLLDRG